MTPDKSKDGKRCTGTSRSSKNIVPQAISTAGANSARRSCTGPTTAVKCNLHYVIKRDLPCSCFSAFYKHCIHRKQETGRKYEKALKIRNKKTEGTRGHSFGQHIYRYLFLGHSAFDKADNRHQHAAANAAAGNTADNTGNIHTAGASGNTQHV